MALCFQCDQLPFVMICAPAAERPASAGDQGRKAASDVRTAQMITLTNGQIRSLCWGSPRRKHSLHAAQPHRQRLVESKISSARVAFPKVPDHSPEPVGFSSLDYLQWR